ncbi:DUF1707 SHOCT-like domain-containing protein [Sinosporangium siamense]|nr:DUF1707 domain-containing protein [Sinosporangium siamense]
MRASDADRDRIAAVLREHYAEGRLNVEEFDERLELAYNAKTHGDLAVLTRDLPFVDMRSFAARPEPTPAKPAKADEGMRGAWTVWAMASGINWVIWLIVSLTTWEGIYPWPLWVMGPWGVVLLVNQLSSGKRKDEK